jgi:hypothetical protein
MLCAAQTARISRSTPGSSVNKAGCAYLAIVRSLNMKAPAARVGRARALSNEHRPAGGNAHIRKTPCGSYSS